MNFFEGLRISLSAIWSHKMRSFLTMLGIIIGIASVVMVVSMGEGSKASIEESFESYGVNRVTISLNGRATGVTGQDRLTLDDIEALEVNFSDEIEAISPYISFNAETSIGSTNASLSISGVNAGYNNIEEKNILIGRYLIESDIEERRGVIVIGEDLAEELFGNSGQALGQRIFLDTGQKKVPATVIGVYEYEESMMSGMLTSYSAYVPYTTVQKVTGSSRYISTVQVNMQPNIDLETVMNRMLGLLETKHNNVGDEKYRIMSAEEQLSMVSDIMGNITLLISGIAAISLLVGGIGVMNIMLVSVTERTREIGIRKAIGARRKDILFQFIVEAVILTMTGGILGTIIGVSASTVIAKLINIPRMISLKSILIAWLFSAMVGLFFGSYPANKAAKLDPIEALRYE